MTQKKGTKRALLLSVLALVMCCSMLIGSTYAWFTDSVTSTGNIIKSGTLKIALKYADGDLDPNSTSTVWNDASNVAIFNYDKWEPGYIDAKHLKVENIGSLAFKYQMQILSNGIVTELADVIDVYFFDSAVQVTRASFTPANRIGTLAEVINNNFGEGASQGVNSFISKTYGELEAGNSKMITVAFKMQESAGNEYQGLEIGTDFSIRLFATQLESESDTFDNTYDDDSLFPAQETPNAIVKRIAPKNLSIKVEGMGDYTLDTGYQFLPTEDYDTIDGNSPYQYWHADYVVSADRDVPANSMMLAGYYKLYDQIVGLDGAWIGFTSGSEVVKAGTQIRLVELLLGESVNYDEICSLGNDGTGFLCGAKDLTGENAGTTLTVTLRLFETEAPSESNGNSHNVETGRYIDIGTFTYLFGGKYETDEAGAVYFYNDNGDITLTDASDVTAEEYTVKEGTTALGNYAFSYANVKTVVLPETVESLGRAFDTSTTVEKVVLNEGLEKIDSRAFRDARALKEVVIPSTVKVIEDNAFQKAYIKEITIPANVETIGETAFGASKIETVIIEGNTSIQGYAFRGCPNLRTVYLNGDDVTFIPSTLNGRNSTWFCNNESNNPNVSNITFYVKNDDVATRVFTAMGAEYGNTPVYINGVRVYGEKASSISTLNNALTDPVDNTLIFFTSNISGEAIVNQPGDADNNIIINGNGYTYDGQLKLKGNSDNDGADDDSLLIKNINFKTSTKDNAFIWSADSSNGSFWRYAHNVTIENCTFTASGEAVNTAVSITVQQAYNITVKNCTATNMHSLLLAESCGSTVAVYDSKVINGKNGISLNNTMNAIVEGCEVESVVDGGYGIRHKGAVNNYALTVKDCTVNAFVPVLIRNMTASGYTATFEGTNSFTATNDFGYEVVVSAGDWDNDANQPPAPTGSYTLIGADSFNKNV